MQNDNLPQRFVRYDYSNAGFDNFLNRSIDSNSRVNLGATGGQPSTSRQMAFDRSQVSGFLGDIFQVGRVQVHAAGYITVLDPEGNEATRFGDLEA